MTDGLIVGLSNVMGHILEDFIGFWMNVSYGWIMLMFVLTTGFMIIIWFRFLRKGISQDGVERR